MLPTNATRSFSSDTEHFRAFTLMALPIGLGSSSPLGPIKRQLLFLTRGRVQLRTVLRHHQCEPRFFLGDVVESHLEALHQQVLQHGEELLPRGRRRILRLGLYLKPQVSALYPVRTGVE